MLCLAVIFSLFIFITLVFLTLLVLGVHLRRPTLIAVAAIFCMLLGAALTSEGLRDESTISFVRVGEVVRVQDFNTLTTSNDLMVGMIAPTFMYGGFLILFVAVGGVVWAVKQRKEGWF